MCERVYVHVLVCITVDYIEKLTNRQERKFAAGPNPAHIH